MRAHASPRGVGVEAAIEAQDRVHAVPFHRRQLDGIAGRHAFHSEQYLLGPLQVGSLDREHVVLHSEEHLERRLDRLGSPHGCTPVEHLLQDFGIRDQPPVLGDHPFQQVEGVELVGV